jgi:hypothetical protein
MVTVDTSRAIITSSLPYSPTKSLASRPDDRHAADVTP